MRSLDELWIHGDSREKAFVALFFDRFGVTSDRDGGWLHDDRWKLAENFWERAVKAALLKYEAHNSAKRAESLVIDALLQEL